MEKQRINMNPHKQEWEYQYVCRIKTVRNDDKEITDIINNAAQDGWIVDKFIQEGESISDSYSYIYISILFKRKKQW